MMPASALLALAIGVEVLATLALRQSDGFTRAGPVALVVVGYATSFVLLGLVLKSIPVSIAYAVWSGAGTALIVVAGLVLGERITAGQLVGVALIILGVIALNTLGEAH